MKASHRVRPVFDDPNLVSAAGLLPALKLADSAGFATALEDLGVPSPNAAAKTACVVAGMLAGADCIDDLDLLRHGGLPRLFDGVRAPSTLGTFLRSFTHGHVQQLDRAGARLLTGLASRVPAVLAADAELGFIDVDDTIEEVYGRAKQAAGFGYSGVRGLNVQVATLSTATSAPVIARARLRRGSVASAKGAGRMLAQAINTARAAGLGGEGAQLMCRADSAYYGWAFVGTAIRHHAQFSVTARMTAAVTAAIAGITDETWQPIQYPHAIWEPTGAQAGEGRWVSDAEVAEVAFTAFSTRRKAERVSCRLIVRRVRRLQPAPAADAHRSPGRAASRSTGPGIVQRSVQGELFAAYRYHAFITNSTLDTVTADQTHRDHAVVEQTIRELKEGPLAHLPSGSYAANAAWVSCAAIAFNIARATATAGEMVKARWATIRTRIINIPARIATTGRRMILHLPTHWPWAVAWQALWATATGPPANPTT